MQGLVTYPLKWWGSFTKELFVWWYPAYQDIHLPLAIEHVGHAIIFLLPRSGTGRSTFATKRHPPFANMRVFLSPDPQTVT